MFFTNSSQKIYSNQITEDLCIKFSPIIQRKITKLTKKNKTFICKQPVFTVLCNKVIDKNPTIIIYKSSDDKINLNCKVNALTEEITYSESEKIIVCRHIAYGYATKKINIKNMSSKKQLQEEPFFKKDYERYYCYYFPAEGYYFQSKNIGRALQDIAKNWLSLNIQGYKSYLLNTISHAMALRIKYKNDHWKIKLYNPNYTSREVIAIIANIDDIILLDINDFMTQANIDSYLKKRDALCLLSTNIKKTQFNCQTQVYGNNKKLQSLIEKYRHYHLLNSFTANINSALMLAMVNNQSDKVKHILMNLIEYNTTELQAFTPSKCVNFMPAFQLCLVKGHLATIKIYLSFILNTDMPIKSKYDLVAGVVHLAIKFNQVAATVVYTNIIMNSDKLSIADKFRFISPDVLLELPYIDNLSENKALVAFIKIIKKSCFSLDQKQKLVSDKLI